MPRPLLVYRDHDIDPAPLSSARVTVLGFGSQGRAQALNLRESGVRVLIGARPGPSGEAAQEAGFEVLPIANAAAAGDVVAVLVPDETQAALLRQEVLPRLQRHALLLFAHGATIHFKEVEPPATCDVGLVAPMGPGALLRSLYLAGRGLNAKVAVYRDVSGGAWPKVLAYARALGCGRAGVIATTFAEETRLDLFSEQAVLCAGVPALAEAAFETLVEAGYPPVLAYIECVREIKYIADLMYEYGLDGMRRRVSSSALFGGAEGARRLVTAETRRTLRQILTEIQDGTFAGRMNREFKDRETLLGQLHNPRLEAARAELDGLLNAE